MAKEIGSEFYELPLEKDSFVKSAFFDVRFFISGRTALDHIIKNIVNEIGLFKAYLPSYCCHTMIEPFSRNGIGINFYSVTSSPNGLRIDYNYDNDASVVLLLDYFGFINPKTSEISNREHNNGKIIIYDTTQSIFSDFSYTYYDYEFCSFRKWFLSYTAMAKSRSGWNIDNATKDFPEYYSIRQKAVFLKKKYMEGEETDKKYLCLFQEAEKKLETDYQDYLSPQWSNNGLSKIDYDFIISKRKRNATTLLDGLHDIDSISFLFNHINTSDCPLFVPIILENGKRNSLRQYLIQNNIYCPIHWPLSMYHKIDSNEQKLYLEELSLVCDQRYTENDMARIVKEIEKWNYD